MVHVPQKNYIILDNLEELFAGMEIYTIVDARILKVTFCHIEIHEGAVSYCFWVGDFYSGYEIYKGEIDTIAMLQKTNSGYFYSKLQAETKRARILKAKTADFIKSRVDIAEREYIAAKQRYEDLLVKQKLKRRNRHG